VYRELAHSPGRETDDALILRATAASLEDRGFQVELRSAEELPETTDAAGVPPFLFVMCERPAAVERLAAWERQGARIVNRPQSIRNTDRERTLDHFARHAIAFPASVLVATDGREAAGAAPAFPLWIKRGDVHATEAGDVSRADGPEELAAGLAHFASRGIARAVLQEHVPGDLIKFYGVAGETDAAAPAWFQWFYHRDQVLANHAFGERALRALVGRAAAALGLEVFGGDAIAGPEGRLVLIDLNAWPSFALYREVAAPRIAEALAARFRKEVGVSR
jgi:glutathione synthase/RimK-type ligase-like ATP-grasp enzyme